MLNKLIFIGICLIIVISVIILIINLDFSSDFEKIEKEAISQIENIGEIIQEKAETIDEIKELGEKHYDLNENEFEKLNTKADVILKDTTEIRKKEYIVRKKNIKPRRIIKYRKKDNSDIIISDYKPPIHPIPQPDIEKVDENNPTLNELWDERDFWRKQGDPFWNEVKKEVKGENRFVKQDEMYMKLREKRKNRSEKLNHADLLITDTSLTPKKVLDRSEKKLYKDEFSVNPVKQSRTNVISVLRDHEKRIKKLENRNNKSTKKVEKYDIILSE